MGTVKLNINLTVSQLIEVVEQLSPKDKLKVSDAIWTEDIEIPVEHQKIVLKRMAKAKTNPERLLDWDEVSKSEGNLSKNFGKLKRNIDGLEYQLETRKNED
jgi:hypothetical protein